MESSRQKYWIGLPCPSPGDLPDPGIEPVSLTPPTLAVRFFTTSANWEATKNIGVGSHSLLQGIFPTQGLNAGLLHCRQILYHLSHQESPQCICMPELEANVILLFKPPNLWYFVTAGLAN